MSLQFAGSVNVEAITRQEKAAKQHQQQQQHAWPVKKIAHRRSSCLGQAPGPCEISGQVCVLGLWLRPCSRLSIASNLLSIALLLKAVVMQGTDPKKRTPASTAASCVPAPKPDKHDKDKPC